VSPICAPRGPARTAGVALCAAVERLTSGDQRQSPYLTRGYCERPGVRRLKALQTLNVPIILAVHMRFLFFSGFQRRQPFELARNRAQKQPPLARRVAPGRAEYGAHCKECTRRVHSTRLGTAKNVGKSMAPERTVKSCHSDQYLAEFQYRSATGSATGCGKTFFAASRLFGCRDRIGMTCSVLSGHKPPPTPPVLRCAPNAHAMHCRTAATDSRRSTPITKLEAQPSDREVLAGLVERVTTRTLTTGFASFASKPAAIGFSSP
jgi:hypothetical protein